MCGGCGGDSKQEERTRAVRSPCCQSAPASTPKPNPCARVNENGQQPPQRNPCIGDYERHMYEAQDEDICDWGPKQPYQIPGYDGHVPTLQSWSGDTYGQETHEVLTSTGGRKPTGYGKAGHICPAPLHEPYRLPGYTGHVPGLQHMVGGTFGQDTHKLLYSVQPYPNRQENLSPFRPTQGGSNFRDASEQPHTHRTQPNLDRSNMDTPYRNQSERQTKTSPGSYQPPSEHLLSPQYTYRIGNTYATTADVCLVDPCVNTEENVTVSTRELGTTQVVRTQDTLEQRVQDQPYVNQPIRHRPMVPGFDAFIDAMRGARGQRFEFTAQSPAHTQLQQQMVLHAGKIRDPRNTDKSMWDANESPVSGQLANEDIPFGYGKYGDRGRYTNSALYDFTSNYRRRLSSEWAPANTSRPDPPIFDPPGEIYNQHTGLLPGYTAHVPGAMFRCGKTFTEDSRDAKRALRGDRF